MCTTRHHIVWCARVSAAWQGAGYTPLFAASWNGHVVVVRALVGAGAAVNQVTVRVDWVLVRGWLF